MRTALSALCLILLAACDGGESRPAAHPTARTKQRRGAHADIAPATAEPDKKVGLERSPEAVKALVAKLKARTPLPLDAPLADWFADGRLEIEAIERSDITNHTGLLMMVDGIFFEKETLSSTYPGMTAAYDREAATILGRGDLRGRPLGERAQVGITWRGSADAPGPSFARRIAHRWFVSQLLVESDRLRPTRPYEAYGYEIIARELLRVLDRQHTSQHVSKQAEMVAKRLAEHHPSITGSLVPKIEVTGLKEVPNAYANWERSSMPLHQYGIAMPASTRSETWKLAVAPAACGQKSYNTVARQDVTATVTTPGSGGPSAESSAEATRIRARLDEIARLRGEQQGRLAWKNEAEKAPVFNQQRCGGVGQPECPKTPEYQGGGASGAQRWVHADAEAKIRELDSERGQLEIKLKALGSSAPPAQGPKTSTVVVGEKFVTGRTNTVTCTAEMTFTLHTGEVVKRTASSSMPDGFTDVSKSALDPWAIASELQQVMGPFIQQWTQAQSNALAAKDPREAAWMKRLLIDPLFKYEQIPTVLAEAFR